MNCRHLSIGFFACIGLLVVFVLIMVHAVPDYPGACEIVTYDAVRYPNIKCLAGRVLAETDPRLNAAQREALWHAYGLRPTFEWIEPESGFTYHELEVRERHWWDYVLSPALGQELPSRELSHLVEQLQADPRITWAAPDAMVLEWCDSFRGVSFIDYAGSALEGSLDTWVKSELLPEPYPDFEYYRECEPGGTQVSWAEALSSSPEFMRCCGTVYGTGQAAALAGYIAAGSPSLAPVTICIADTGIELNHPDFKNRLHPNAFDANFRNYRVTGAGDRPGQDEEITDRGAFYARGLPREAIKGRPAAHGTEVAGVLARCTEGFSTADGSIRILPASLKSDNTMAITGTKVKSPISSFVKLVACLHREFPVGEFIPAPDDPIQNTGDVRVVSISASVPKRYFSDAEWRIVASIAGKAAGSIAEDLRDNDRVYVFAAGNEGMGVPSRPGDVDFVLAVSASMAYDGSLAWSSPATGEGSNMGAKCVSAPGYGIITSDLTGGPNLAYLDPAESAGRDNFSTPPRTEDWYIHTNSFGATSSATPQAAALAALLYAQDPSRGYPEVINRIQNSTNGRILQAEWGESMGLIDYQVALGW